VREPKRVLIYDVANVLFRVAAVQKYSPYARDASEEDMVGLCMHMALYSIYKWFEKYRPEFVVFAFEGSNNWRKKYTAETYARKAFQYKGNRVIDPAMKHYYQLIDSFRETIKAHTSICCLHIDTMECDDAIAGYCQLNAQDGKEIFIVSGDRDFVQLLKLPGVKLVNPDDGKLRNQPGDKHYQPDIDYWLFEKCVRGDMGDYVPSAYPRVRATKIREAYQSEYARINFMNTIWTETLDDGKTVAHRVGDLFEHNVLLLDLYKQPTEVRTALLQAVQEQSQTLGHYSHFHFLRFLDKHRLEKVRENAVRFVDMFTNNQRFLKGEQILQTTKPPVREAEDSKPAPRAGLLEF